MIIRTYQNRHLDAFWGRQLIRCAYDDEPATLDTWDRNAATIADEEKIDIMDTHLHLMRFAPHMYG